MDKVKKIKVYVPSTSSNKIGACKHCSDKIIIVCILQDVSIRLSVS